MSTRPFFKSFALAALALAGFSACDGEAPTSARGLAHDHATSLDVMIQDESRPEVRRLLVELRKVSAKFHNIDHAVAAGYDFNIGCIDETVVPGVDPAQARGMGYHVTKSGTDLIGDPSVDLLEPELLVYAPSKQDASLPPEQRVAAAKLVGFDYFVPDPDKSMDPPPSLFGDEFGYEDVFQGWVRHIYLWDQNPDGLYEDWNANVPLCTDLLAAEPIG